MADDTEHVLFGNLVRDRPLPLSPLQDAND